MADSTKISASITPAAIAALDERIGGNAWHATRSGMISQIIERYAHAATACAPDLSEAEWSMIFDSLNGSLHEAWVISAVEVGIADSIRLDALDEKWQVDGAALLRKLQALDYAGKLAVVDRAEKFWAVCRREQGVSE